MRSANATIPGDERAIASESHSHSHTIYNFQRASHLVNIPATTIIERIRRKRAWRLRTDLCSSGVFCRRGRSRNALLQFLFQLAFRPPATVVECRAKRSRRVAEPVVRGQAGATEGEDQAVKQQLVAVHGTAGRGALQPTRNKQESITLSSDSSSARL